MSRLIALEKRGLEWVPWLRAHTFLASAWALVPLPTLALYPSQH